MFLRPASRAACSRCGRTSRPGLGIADADSSAESRGFPETRLDACGETTAGNECLPRGGTLTARPLSALGVRCSHPLVHGGGKTVMASCDRCTYSCIKQWLLHNSQLTSSRLYRKSKIRVRLQGRTLATSHPHSATDSFQLPNTLPQIPSGTPAPESWCRGLPTPPGVVVVSRSFPCP